MMLTIDAEDDWWPPTFTPSAFSRPRFAASMIDVASHRTRWAISSRTSVLADARSGRSFAVGGSICVDVSNWTPSSLIARWSVIVPSGLMRLWGEGGAGCVSRRRSRCTR